MPRIKEEKQEVELVKVKRVDGNKIGKQGLTEDQWNKLMNYEVVEIPITLLYEVKGIKIEENING